MPKPEQAPPPADIVDIDVTELRIAHGERFVTLRRIETFSPDEGAHVRWELLKDGQRLASFDDELFEDAKAAAVRYLGKMVEVDRLRAAAQQAEDDALAEFTSGDLSRPRHFTVKGS